MLSLNVNNILLVESAFIFPTYCESLYTDFYSWLIMLKRNRHLLRVVASGTVLALPAWYTYEYSSNNGLFNKKDSLSPYNKFYTPCKIISS